MPDWPQVVRDFGPLVWQTACRLLSNEADAADCFQRTFVSAVELAAAEPVRDWPAALRRLATARALEQLRQRYRDAPRRGAYPDELPPDPAVPDPLDAAAGAELADALRAALAGIDPRQAEVFCLAAIEGLTYPEVAAHLGLTANHVGVLLNRARAVIRVRLRAFDPTRDCQPGGARE